MSRMNRSPFMKVEHDPEDTLLDLWDATKVVGSNVLGSTVGGTMAIPESIFGDRGMEGGIDLMEGVQEAFAVQPSRQGSAEKLRDLGEALAPIEEGKQWMGDKSYNAAPDWMPDEVKAAWGTTGYMAPEIVATMLGAPGLLRAGANTSKFLKDYSPTPLQGARGKRYGPNKTQGGSFGGPQAKTADHKKMAVAKDMKDAGANKDKIFQETGWVETAPGEWNFRISDVGMKPTKNRNPMTFGDAYDHPELYAAYPGAANVPYEASSINLPDNVEGQFTPGGGPGMPAKIDINRSAKKPMITANHEINHYTQALEDQVGGSNLRASDYVRQGMSLKLMRDKMAIEQSPEYKVALKDELNNIITNSGTPYEQMSMMQRANLQKEARATLAEQFGVTNALAKRDEWENATAGEVYERDWGEAKSRSSQDELEDILAMRDEGFTDLEIDAEIAKRRPSYDLPEDQLIDTQDLMDKINPGVPDNVFGPSESRIDGGDPRKPRKWARHKKRKDGTIPGAPAKMNTQNQVRNRREHRMNLADSGQKWRGWYPRTVDDVKRSTSGDVGSRHEFGNLLARTSASTMLPANLQHASTGYYQRLMGDDMTAGIHPNKMREDLAKNRMDTGEFGPKLQPYREDVTGRDLFPDAVKRAVHDIWAARVAGYGDKWDQGLSPAQHSFMDVEDINMLKKGEESGLFGPGEITLDDWQAMEWGGVKKSLESIPPEREGWTYGNFADEAGEAVATMRLETAPPKAMTDRGHMSEFDSLPYERKQDIHNVLMDMILDDRGQPKAFMGIPSAEGADMTGGLFWGKGDHPGAWDEDGKQYTNPMTSLDYGAGSRSTDWTGERHMKGEPHENLFKSPSGQKEIDKKNKFVTMEDSTKKVLGAEQEFLRVMMLQAGLGKTMFKNAGANMSNSSISRLPGIHLDVPQTQALAKRISDKFGDDAALGPSRRGIEILDTQYDRTPERTKEIAAWATKLAKEMGVKPQRGYNAARGDDYSYVEGFKKGDAVEFSSMMNRIDELLPEQVAHYERAAAELADDWINKGFPYMSQKGAGEPTQNILDIMNILRGENGFTSLKDAITAGRVSAVLAVPVLQMIMGEEQPEA